MDIDALPVAGTPLGSTEKLPPLPPFVNEAPAPAPAPAPQAAPPAPAPPSVSLAAALRFTAKVLRDAADLAEGRRGMDEWIEEHKVIPGVFAIGAQGGDVAGPDGKPFDPGPQTF